jgi:hypothetical protein
MAPPSADVDTARAPQQQQTFLSKLAAATGTTAPADGQAADSAVVFPKPLVDSGSLNEYKFVESTPIIGREYPEAKLVDILKDDAKIRDLAIQGIGLKHLVLSLQEAIAVAFSHI